MTTPTHLPNTYDIAAQLITDEFANGDGWIDHDMLFVALQDHWTDDGCVARIEEAVSAGVLIEAPATRYRLGKRDGLPNPSPERDKLEQIAWLKTLVAEFEAEDRECYCPHCFLDFVDETQEMLESLDAPTSQALN